MLSLTCFLIVNNWLDDTGKDMTWKYSQNISSERIAYLSKRIDFQEIIGDIDREMVIVDYDIEDSRCFSNCIRHNFILSITPKTYDIFFRFFSRICGRFSVPATFQVYDIGRFGALPHSENHTLFS